MGTFTTENSIRDAVPIFQQGLIIANLFLTVLMFILYCFAEPADFSFQADAKNNSEKVSPEMYSSWPNTLFFHWFTEICRLGSKRALTDEDLWKLNRQDNCGVCGDKLGENWAEALENFEKEEKNVKKSETNQIEPEKETLKG